ncbi:hypothetical protein M1146_02740 [Patescibacteria group bacterium]|nr:hypothetical protein [Patescibacteria group bacterium]
MKSIEMRTRFNSDGLTSQPVHPTLEKRGDIFMLEPGQGEQPPKQPGIKPTLPETESSQTPIGRQVTPEMVQRARGAWNNLNLGRNVSVDERRTQEELIRRGFMPDDLLSSLGEERGTSYEENQSEEARRAWERYNEQGFGPPVDRDLQEQLIRDGILPPQPPAGGPPFGGGGREGTTPEDDNNRWFDDIKRATAEGNFDEVDRLINENLDLGDPYAGPKIKALAEISLSNEALASGMYGYLLEYAMERVINQSDITPTDDYVQFTYYQQENLARIILAARDFDKSETKDFYKYLSRLRNKRYIAHELFRSIKNREQYKEVISRYLRTEGFNFLENEIVGVPTTQMLWEKVLAHKVAGKKYWLDGEDLRNAHEEIGELLKRRHDKKPLQKTIVVNGQQVSRVVRPWEIDRAIVIGRAVAAATQRRTSYGVLGEVPEEFDTLFKSLDSEYIARVIAGLKVIGQRFLAQGTGASKKYMELLRKNIREIGAERGQAYGYKDSKKRDRGLYGHDVDSWILLDSGVPDVKSHSWRSTLMFLKERDYAIVNAGSPDSSITIGDYLDGVLKSIKEEDLDNVLKGLTEEQRKEELEYINDPNLQHINKSVRIKNVVFSSRVSEVVLNQRLYLGTLVRHPNLTPRLKAEIWKNISKYLPSRIAAFFPAERRDIASDEEWNVLVQKLWIAEEMRVETQADRIKNKDFTEETLGDHYGEDMTVAEREKIEDIIKLGNRKARDLARMLWPFSPFLDDVPKTGWMELEEADLERLLVSDHDAYNTAINQELAAVIANPTMRPSASAEHLVKAKDAYAQPIGGEGAQERLEAHVLTRTELYSMKEAAKWYGYAIMRLLRKPTSLIEEYNVDAAISMDEGATAKDLEFLAQHEVVGSDTTKRDALGFTMLERIKRKSKATRGHIWLMYIRLLMALLPAEMAKEFVKILVPGDLAKSLG